MKRNLLFVLFLCAGQMAYGQGNFSSVKDQRVIAKNKIRQITCYLFKNIDKPNEGELTDSLIFNKKGLCISRCTDTYIHQYLYNAKGQLVQELTKPRNRADSVVTVYKYDKRGNQILSADIKTSNKIRVLNLEHILHKFDYDSKGRLLRDYWVNFKGKETQVTRIKYVNTNLEPGLSRAVYFYDERDKLSFVKKYYKNNQVKDYSIDNGKLTFAAEGVLNKNGDLLTFTDYYHSSGNAKHDTITEVYKYTPYGFCSQVSTYKRNQLTQYLKWFFKR